MDLDASCMFVIMDELYYIYDEKIIDIPFKHPCTKSLHYVCIC